MTADLEYLVPAAVEAAVEAFAATPAAGDAWPAAVRAAIARVRGPIGADECRRLAQQHLGDCIKAVHYRESRGGPARPCIECIRLYEQLTRRAHALQTGVTDPTEVR